MFSLSFSLSSLEVEHRASCGWAFGDTPALTLRPRLICELKVHLSQSPGLPMQRPS